MLLILFLFTYLLQIVPQDTKSFEFLNTSSGLSNNIAFDIYQDTEGFIWVATDNGLNKYDGYTFDTFYHSTHDSTSISSNVVRTIIEDQKGNLWIGTKNGLNLYHKESQSFTRYTTTLDSIFSNLDIKELATDTQGNIWFNTLRVFGYFDPTTEQFTIIDPSFHSFAMTTKDDDGLWVSSESGVLNYLPFASNKFSYKGEASEFSRRQIYYGPYSKKLWIPPTDSSQIFDDDFLSLPVLPNGLQPTRLMEIEENTLLIGTTDGLYAYIKNLKQLQKWTLSNDKSTLNQQIQSIYKDRNGGVWIGTLGGVYHYDPYGKPFGHIDIDPEFDDVVMGMKKVENEFYINTLGKAIYKLDSKGIPTQKIPLPDRFLPGGSFIWAIEKVPENEFPIWMATDSGLLRYDTTSNRFKEISLPFYEPRIKSVFTLLSTKKDYLWVASGKAIHQISKKKGHVLKTYHLYDTLKENNLQKLIFFNDQFFVGTEGGGLYTFSEDTGQLSPLNLINSKGVLHPFSPTVWDLHIYDNTLWVGTNKGLYKVSHETLGIEPVFDDNHIIFSIAHDQQGRLWMGSEKELISYEVATKNLKFYSGEDGIQNIEFNRRSALAAENGKLWFGGVNGITVFDPESIQINTIIPPVFITDVSVITADSTFQVNSYKKSITLPWDQNTLTLDYVALNYTNAFQNQYKYQMKGYDPDWVTNNLSRQARYVQLPPGEYSFQVIGSNNDGIWNQEGDHISIHILPPYWETWWFRSALLLLIVVAIWILYTYRVRKLLEVERMKLRIAGDLHDEIGSGLSGIALTGDILKQQIAQDSIKPQLVSRITTNARTLAANLDDIVWLINPKKETLGDLIMKVKTMANEFLHDTSLEIEDSVPDVFKKKVLSSEFKRNLLLLSKEAIHNIVKHSKADHVTLTIYLKGQTVHWRFRDDGLGFDQTEQNVGSGLISMRHRAQLLKAHLSITSEIQKGTEIHLQLKIP